MGVHDGTGYLVLYLGELLHGSLQKKSIGFRKTMKKYNLKIQQDRETLAAELATRGSTTLARKATVLMIGFPELNMIEDDSWN